MSEIMFVELSFARSIVSSCFLQSTMSFLDSFMMVSSPFCWSFIFSTNKAKTAITRFLCQILSSSAFTHGSYCIREEISLRIFEIVDIHTYRNSCQTGPTSSRITDIFLNKPGPDWKEPGLVFHNFKRFNWNILLILSHLLAIHCCNCHTFQVVLDFQMLVFHKSQVTGFSQPFLQALFRHFSAHLPVLPSRSGDQRILAPSEPLARIPPLTWLQKWFKYIQMIMIY